jgi:predicted ATPase
VRRKVATRPVDRLTGKGTVRSVASPAVGCDRASRFRHILIRDAPYSALPKGERAELHERFADFQEQAAGDRLPEYEEVIGYHLEQATHYRQGVGRNDERTRDLARRAAQLLGAAGVRPIQRGDALASNRQWRLTPSGFRIIV